MATQAEIRRLYLKLVEVLGQEAADTLMELLRTGHDHRRDLPDPALEQLPSSSRTRR